MPMGMTDDGHVIHAQSMFASTFHLAWGSLPSSYPAPWGLADTPPIPNSQISTDTITRGPTLAVFDALLNVGILTVISVSQGSTVYVQGTDFALNGRSIQWLPGGASPQAATTYTVIYRYNTTKITSIVNELGRQAPTIQLYAYADPNGPIIANDSSWTSTTTPTSNIYLQFKFDSTAAVGNIISQLGIFIGTVRNPSVLPGQMYLMPGDIQSPGKLYMLENVSPYARFAGKREVYEYVLSY